MKTTSMIINTFLLLAGLCLTACDLSVRRTETNEKELASARASLAQSQKNEAEAKTETEQTKDHMKRMRDCHRDFAGNLGVVVEKSVKLVRENQRVVRKSCKGSTNSDEGETVTSPRENVSLSEFPLLKKYMYKAFVKNRQSCSLKGLYRPSFVGLRLSEPTLWIDHADALLTHQVQPGINTIDFGLCQDVTDDKNGIARCPEITWIGTLKLNVDYQEVQLDGVKTVDPAKESCQ
jgi:hypothetical protein